MTIYVNHNICRYSDGDIEGRHVRVRPIGPDLRRADQEDDEDLGRRPEEVLLLQQRVEGLQVPYGRLQLQGRGDLLHRERHEREDHQTGPGGEQRRQPGPCVRHGGRPR